MQDLGPNLLHVPGKGVFTTRSIQKGHGLVRMTPVLLGSKEDILKRAKDPVIVGRGIIMYQTTFLYCEAIPHIKHHCNPNSSVLVTTNGAQAYFYALQDLKRGEEVTISYLDHRFPLQERQIQAMSLGFYCTCTECVREKEKKDPSGVAEKEKEKQTLHKCSTALEKERSTVSFDFLKGFCKDFVVFQRRYLQTLDAIKLKIFYQLSEKIFCHEVGLELSKPPPDKTIQDLLGRISTEMATYMSSKVRAFQQEGKTKISTESLLLPENVKPELETFPQIVKHLGREKTAFVKRMNEWMIEFPVPGKVDVSCAVRECPPQDQKSLEKFKIPWLTMRGDALHVYDESIISFWKKSPDRNVFDVNKFHAKIFTFLKEHDPDFFCFHENVVNDFFLSKKINKAKSK